MKELLKQIKIIDINIVNLYDNLYEKNFSNNKFNIFEPSSGIIGNKLKLSNP